MLRVFACPERDYFDAALGFERRSLLLQWTYSHGPPSVEVRA